MHSTSSRTLDLVGLNQSTFVARISAPNERGCRLWTGRQLGKYGSLKLRGRQLYAHRVAWTLAKGAIPNGMILLHTCDVPLCCNVEHLRLGTHADNIADMHAKGRANIARGVQRTSAKLTDASVVEIHERAGRGESMPSIAARMGVAASRISDILNAKSWTHVPNPNVARRRRTTLTQDDVQFILDWASAGWTHEALARVFKLTRPAISQIIRRRSRDSKRQSPRSPAKCNLYHKG